MRFSKNVVFFGLFLCVGSVLAMDPVSVNYPKKVLLYPFLACNDFKSIYSVLSKMDNNGTLSVVDVNEKNLACEPFVFRLLDALLIEDSQILKKKYSLKESIASINNANLLSQCLRLVIRNKTFKYNEIGASGLHLFCSILEVIDMNYNNKLRYKEREALYGEEYDNVDIAKYDNLNKSNHIKNLYECICLLMEKQSFNPNIVLFNPSIDANKVKSFLHYWLNRMNELHNYENANKLIEPEDELFILEGLLKRGANTNQADYMGCFPLHYIAERGCDTYQNIFATERSLKIAEMLLQHGAHVNCVDSQGKTPLHFCCDDTTMVPLFCLYGAHVARDINIINPSVNYMLDNLNSIKQIAAKEKLAVLCQGKNMANFVMRREISGPLNTPKNEYPITSAIMMCTKEKGMSYEIISAAIDAGSFSGSEDSVDSW